MGEPGSSSRSESAKVKVDGEETVMHITDQSLMFEKAGRISGFERNAIRMVKPDKDAIIIAYSVGSEVKSIRVEPISVVASLLVSEPAYMQSKATGLEDVFEKLYWDTRKELEERLVKVQSEPENKTMRLTPEEEAKYSQISRQMENLLGSKHGFNPRLEDSPISFWGLERQSVDLQRQVVKVLHISFLRLITCPRAEKTDVVFSGMEVWPEDWSRILSRFDLHGELYSTERFTNYIKFLKSNWKYQPGDRKPLLLRS